MHATGTNNEQVEVQSKSNEAHPSPQIVQPVKKNYITPKIWMDFDDFCSCFTSVVVFHNPRGYQYIHKHTEVKVNYQLMNDLVLIIKITQIFLHMFIFSYFSSFSHLNR